MKLAYLVNQYPAPSQSFIRREIAALEKLDHTVLRFALRPFPTPAVDPLNVEEQEKTRYVLHVGAVRLLMSLFGTLFTSPGRFFNAWGAMRRLSRNSTRGFFVHLIYLAEACVLTGWLKRERIEHLHAHFGTNSAAVAMLSRLLGGPPYSSTIHGPEEFDAPRHLSLSEKVKHSAFTVAITNFTRGQIWRWCDASDWQKIQIVRCGVDQMFLQQHVTPPPNEPRIVCVGRLCAAKGPLLLLDAIKQLRDDGVKVHLSLVGGGELEDACKQRAREHNIEDLVTFHGWMSSEDVRKEIVNAKALVLNSFAEGLPVVIMEAFACRRPVISTYVAGIPELIEPGVSGWLIPAGNVPRLVRAIREALDTDPQRLLEMGQSGATAIAERHDATREAGQLAKHISDALESSKVKAAEPSATTGFPASAAR